MALWGSRKGLQNNRITWSARAEEELKKLPGLVRPMVKSKVEEMVAKDGGEEVSPADYARAKARFKAVAGGAGERELEGMMPQPNRPGAGLTVLNTCRSELTGCPNQLIQVETWRRLLEDWLKDDQISERMRASLQGDTVLYHHKLKLAISGCPNGCARHQIADMALVGAVRPRLTPADCRECGLCVDACPDQAISQEAGPAWIDPGLCQGCLSCSRVCPVECISSEKPFVRLFVGGKLGRHPRLARPVLESDDPAEVISLIRRIFGRFMDDAHPGRRFADWWSQNSQLF